MLSWGSECISNPGAMLHIWTYNWNDTKVIPANNKQEEIT